MGKIMVFIVPENEEYVLSDISEYLKVKGSYVDISPVQDTPSTCRRLAWIPSSPKVALIHVSASGASVVTVQPYFACFSI